MSTKKIKKNELPYLGPLIKTLRNKRGWSQETLCKISGVSQSTLSRIENNDMSVKIANFRKLLKALNVSSFLAQSKIDKLIIDHLQQLSAKDKVALLQYLLKLRNIPYKIEEILVSILPDIE